MASSSSAAPMPVLSALMPCPGLGAPRLGPSVMTRSRAPVLPYAWASSLWILSVSSQPPHFLFSFRSSCLCCPAHLHLRDGFSFPIPMPQLSTTLTQWHFQAKMKAGITGPSFVSSSSSLISVRLVRRSDTTTRARKGMMYKIKINFNKSNMCVPLA